MNLPHITAMPNGIVVATDRMDQVETATLGVWVSVGTRNEAPHENGVSHMLEHMAFKGTKRRSARGIAEEIEAVGGHLNAYTGREATAYHAKVLKDDVPLALDIIADILQHSVFDADELAREREVVLQELGQARDTPDDIVFDHFQATAFPNQPLGRPVLGSVETVSALERRTLFDHMARHYHGCRMIVAAAGNIEHEAIADLTARLFGSVPPGVVEPPQVARYAGGDYRGAEDLEQVHLVLGLPSIPLGHPDQYAVSVLSTVLGGGMSSRLFQEAREKRGLVYSIYSFNSSFTDCGVFGVYAGTGEKSLRQLVPLIFDELTGTADAVKPEELMRAKAQLKADLLMSLESTGARAEQTVRQLTTYGRVLPIAEIVAAVESVDAAAVRRCAQRLVQGPLTVAALGPVQTLESYAEMSARLAR